MLQHDIYIWVKGKSTLCEDVYIVLRCWSCLVVHSVHKCWPSQRCSGLLPFIFWTVHSSKALCPTTIFSPSSPTLLSLVCCPIHNIVEKKNLHHNYSFCKICFWGTDFQTNLTQQIQINHTIIRNVAMFWNSIQTFKRKTIQASKFWPCIPENSSKFSLQRTNLKIHKVSTL